MGDLILALMSIILIIILLAVIFVIVGVIACTIVWLICKVRGKENRLTEIVDDILIL